MAGDETRKRFDDTAGEVKRLGGGDANRSKLRDEGTACQQQAEALKPSEVSVRTS